MIPPSADGPTIRIAAAQIAPVWLDRTATLQKVLDAVTRAAEQECALVAFGEALVPGYPSGWSSRRGPVRITRAEGMDAYYAEQAVSASAGI